MTLYEYLVQNAQIGNKISISLGNRNIKCNKRVLVKQGVINNDMDLIDEPFSIEKLEELYQIYKHSLPNERSENQRKNYFYAKPLEEMSTKEMCIGENRSVAQVMLEAYLLCHILKGLEYFGSGFFWQSKSDKDFIVLRKYFESEVA